MIYTTKFGVLARRSTWRWGTVTFVAAAVLGVLLAVVLAACGPSGAGRVGAASDGGQASGAAGLGGAPTGGGDSGSAGSGEPQTGGTGDDPDHPDGGGSGDDGDDGEPVPTVQPAAEDCVTYDPANLTIEQSGDAWRMRDGDHAIKLFATKTDAEDGVKVARNWTRLCFIGRGNDRADRHRYIITHFQGPSGLPFGPAPQFDCITYDPAELAVHGPDGDGWGLRAAATPLLFLASAADAERARLVAAGNTRLCLIGHGNGQPDPSRYQLEYWRQ
ncbi:hypothetical protein O7621_14285 [Solwaraspora sp. WMMD937]|uniref:hypothetical protein n=1 Tax=Solwaraspora sp. WMMD937 TaxID=3016090 RepID=UPI00249CE519|nr:hypothetical protein [Solwaraspora sp. WMMD937]WFE24330.1 hypothetical protein O7621_14285 [Solwaraspora sp. WMMD937]